MLQKFFVSLFFILLIGAFPLSAANVSVLVIETGLPNDNRGPHQYSIMWENGLMDVYFEMGHIVSNSPITRINSITDGGFPFEVERFFDDARETGMDYFVVAIIRHPVPFTVSLRVFNTNSHDMLKEITLTDNISLPQRDRMERIKDAVQETYTWIR